jgi:hypothetical protein
MTIFNLHLPGGNRGSGSSIAFSVLCSVFGLWLLFRGLRGDIFDESGIAKAPRWFYVTLGIVLQMPAIIYAYMVSAAN